MTVVTSTREGAVAHLVLNRPEAGNAIDMAMAEALGAAASVVAVDPMVRCVTLTGAGRLFCAGGDVGGMAKAGDEAPAFLRTLADTLHKAIVTLTRMQKPLVTLVNGPAAGAGLSLAILGDIVIAAEAATFTAAYTGIGLTPDGGMSWLLPRVAGLRRAQSMILTNERVGSAEAARIGLVTRVVADAELGDAGRDAASRMVAAPTMAIGAARGLLLAGSSAAFESHLNSEAATIAAAGGRPEAQEGLAAFLARRRPAFEKA